MPMGFECSMVENERCETPKACLPWVLRLLDPKGKDTHVRNVACSRFAKSSKVLGPITASMHLETLSEGPGTRTYG